jgi:hypothetical protein
MNTEFTASAFADGVTADPNQDDAHGWNLDRFLMMLSYILCLVGRFASPLFPNCGIGVPSQREAGSRRRAGQTHVVLAADSVVKEQAEKTEPRP